jgi:2-polyprenyl-3-methyl-5-hydroxy-6-metoxy-1,4-benzoquinol methylase
MTERANSADQAQERLSPDEVAAESLLASTHLHRYEFAAELVDGLRVLDLCCGTGYGAHILAGRAAAVRGVDIDEEAIAVARRTAERSRLGAPVEFTRADALDHLRGLNPTTCDVVLCFEGIEHVPDPVGLLDAMAGLARQGKRLIVSLPNSRGFDEENPFHVIDPGYEEAMELFARLGEPIVISQFLAEGSILLERDKRARELAGRLVGDAEPAPEWANNWVALVGVPREELRRATARLHVAASANNNEYMRALERANMELARVNRRLARNWLGVHDAAAATILHKYERRATEAENRVAWLEDRLALEVEVAKRNDRLFQDARRALASPRYRAADKVRDLVLATPGVGRLLGAVWRRIWRA